MTRRTGFHARSTPHQKRSFDQFRDTLTGHCDALEHEGHGPWCALEMRMKMESAIRPFAP